MKPEAPDGAQRYSNLVAFMAAAALLLALQIAPPRWIRPGSQARSDTDAVQLSLTAPELQAPAPTPPPPQTRRSPPPATLRSAAPVPPVPDPLPQSQSPPEEAAVVASEPVSPPAPSEPSHANADLEAEYAAALRADIDRRTHSAEFSQSRPRRLNGVTQVLFAVTRSGEPRSVAVGHSSGSASLDRIALSVVGSGRYPPMPDAIFAHESEHLFGVTIEFGDSMAHH